MSYKHDYSSNNNQDQPKSTGKIVVAKSFVVFIERHINQDFKEGDLEKGFTKIDNISIGGEIWYRRPPKDKLVKAVFKKRNMNVLLENKYKEILPDLIYYV